MGLLIAELRRRNVFRMAGLYLVAAWLIVQVAGTVLPMFSVPEWVARSVVLVLAIGFVPALAFAWVFELTPKGLRRDSAVPPEHSIAPQTARRLDRAMIIVLVFALAYFGFDKFLLAPRREAALVDSATIKARREVRSAPVATRERSIAVLPFVNLSSDPEQAYFSDGLSEDLITALSQLAGLKVIARNSSFRFRGNEHDPKSIGAQLGVVQLLTGSVRRAGETVRISADLVDVADGRTLWSQRFDRPYADLFALQDEITTAVAQALRTRLLGDAGAVVQDDRPPGGDVDAYNAYLQGRFHADRGTRGDHAKAFGYYDEAILRDPRYARAHAAMASVRVMNSAIFLGGAESRAAVASARRSINTALALAPDSTYVHVVDARVLTNGELRWVDAERAARRALALAPGSPEALGMLAQTRAALGHADEAVSLMRQGQKLDPLSSGGWYWLSITLSGMGRLEEAEQALDRMIELQPLNEPGMQQRAAIHVLRGNHREAVAIAEAMPPGNWRDIALAIATQGAGDNTAADRALRELIERGGEGSGFQIAETYALRGEPDQAFAWLERAWTNRDPGLRRLLTDPFLAPYRGDLRFAAFCRKIGLPPPDDEPADKAATSL